MLDEEYFCKNICKASHPVTRVFCLKKGQNCNTDGQLDLRVYLGLLTGVKTHKAASTHTSSFHGPFTN